MKKIKNIKRAFILLLIIFISIHIQFSLNQNITPLVKSKINIKGISELTTTSLTNVINRVDKINYFVASPKEEIISQNTKNISSNKVITNNIENISLKNDSLGTMGRLYLPSVNLNVAIYYANVQDNENYNAQYIVDKVDSAAYFQIGEKNVIADHNYQGFQKIIDLAIGSKAYIKKSDGEIETYQLNNKFLGKNNSRNLVDSNGNSIQNIPGSLIMYTCYNSNDDVFITMWDKI